MYFCHEYINMDVYSWWIRNNLHNLILSDTVWVPLCAQCVCLRVFRWYLMAGAPPPLAPPPLPHHPPPSPTPWIAVLLPLSLLLLTARGEALLAALKYECTSNSDEINRVCVFSVSTPACGQLDAVSWAPPIRHAPGSTTDQSAVRDSCSLQVTLEWAVLDGHPVPPTRSETWCDWPNW